MRSRRWTGLAVLLAAAGAGCGGSESAEQEKIVAPMAAAPVVETSQRPTLNQEPRILSLTLTPEDPIRGDRLRANVEVEDADGDKVTINFLWHVRGERIDNGGASLALNDASRGDSITVEATASDGRGGSDVASDDVTVRNQAPVVIGVGLHPSPSVAPGEPVVASAQGEDPDGDALSYKFHWRVNGRQVSERGPRLETDELDRDDEIQVFATTSDGDLESEQAESVVVKIGNAHPLISSNPAGSWADGKFNYEIEAKDPDHSGRLRYALRTGPDGMVVDPVVGNVSWTPTAAQAGEHEIAVTVTDSHGATAVQSFQLSVGVVETPAATPANASN